MDWTETATVVEGARGFVFTIVAVGSKFNAAVAEGSVTDAGDFVEERLTMIGTGYRSTAGARRACAAYLRRVRRAAVCAPTDDPAVLAQLAFAEAVSSVMREAGTIPQA
jgi:hypothetical protein